MTIDHQHKAIETQYAGTLFRSRLEARWAVVFDHLGIRWEYEPEAFLFEGWGEPSIGYLPDFWLPATKTWVEVKGSPETLLADNGKLAMACEGGSPLWNMIESAGSTSGLLILGPLPRSDEPTDPWIVQHHKGIVVNALELDTFTLQEYNIGDATPVHTMGHGRGYGQATPLTDLEDALKLLTGSWHRYNVRADTRRWSEALSAGRSARFDPASRRSRYGL